VRATGTRIMVISLYQSDCAGMLLTPF